MTKYKAKIRIAEKPMQIIKWFTKNFEKEVGALGIGEMKDGELIVERLVFPQQIVNGVHVHFKPEDWAPIIKELSVEDIGKIVFYWHKHPGSASASQGDEDDTFDVFMPADTDRPFFGFLQTATKHSGGMEYEARIEMRTPIFASITDVEIVTDEDDSIEEECQKIIEKSITIGNASASDQPGNGKEKEEIKDDKKIPQVKFDKNITYGEGVMFDVKTKNGQLILTITQYFEDWICSLLEGDELEDLFHEYETDIVNEHVSTITIHPKKKKLKDLYKYFKAIDDQMTDNVTIETLESSVTNSGYKDDEETDNWNKGFNQNWNNRGYNYFR